LIGDPVNAYTARSGDAESGQDDASGGSEQSVLWR